MMVQKISRKMQVLVWEENPMLVSLFFFYLFLIIGHFFALVSCMLYSHARISVRQITTMEFLGNASFPFIKA